MREASKKSRGPDHTGHNANPDACAQKPDERIEANGFLGTKTLIKVTSASHLNEQQMLCVPVRSCTRLLYIFLAQRVHLPRLRAAAAVVVINSAALP